MVVTAAPARWATSVMRWPKTPLTQTTILSPGSIRLTTQVSMPADAGAADGERQTVLRAEHLAQHLLRLVHDVQELGIEMADQRRRHGGQDARMNVAGTGTEQDTRRRIQLTGNRHGLLLNCAACGLARTLSRKRLLLLYRLHPLLDQALIALNCG